MDIDKKSKSNHSIAVLLVALGLATASATRAEVPVTGAADARLASFDRLMTGFLTEHDIPGAALAVAKQGRLVYARGFGRADRETGEPVSPRALFRIASVSKPITAVAVLQLVERGKLTLDAPVFDLLKVEVEGKPVPACDPRLKRVTIRHLLEHRGGWDREKSFDPMFRPLAIAREFHARPPAGPELILAYMWKRPLDFDPGLRDAYSNFGYCVLGRAIEKVTGMGYEQYVRQEVLAPLGIRDMRIGKTLLEGREPGEVRYDSGKKAKEVKAVVGPELGKPVPVAYGGWYLEALDAHGGWIGSAPDLVRFASAFDDPAHCPILGAASIRTMFAPPEGRAGHRPDGKPKERYYACGWLVGRLGPHGELTTWHTGGFDGTSAILVRRFDGLTWAVLFNTSDAGNGKAPVKLIDPLVHQAADAVKQWPEIDLFAGMLGDPR